LARATELLCSVDFLVMSGFVMTNGNTIYTRYVLGNGVSISNEALNLGVLQSITMIHYELAYNYVG
jgi:hypothetical protein